MAQTGTAADFEFEVLLGGRLVGCATLEDAICIKAANDILVGDDPTTYSAEQLAPLVAVLNRYGFNWAAELIA
ncbi:MAG TPA: hypothetical protein VF175_16480 [Lacipirellula sp.]